MGLHHEYTANQFGSAGKFFLKAKIYKPKKSKEEEKLYLNSENEQIVYIRKIHTQHWALREIKSEFKVCSLNKWNAHPINITNISLVGRNYTILAESMRGPQIIEHKNTFALQFQITSKCSESIQILNNYIVKRTEDLKVFSI